MHFLRFAFGGRTETWTQTSECSDYSQFSKLLPYQLGLRGRIEDNIMHVSSKAIITELLEITFNNGNKLHEYQLPLDTP